MADNDEKKPDEDAKAAAAAEKVAASVKAAESKGAQPASNGKTMHVKVYAPFKTYFDGEAVSVSAVNDTGPFDILPRHHNFMTLVNQCDIVIRTETSEEKVPINRGVMHVKADKVDIFLDV